MNCDCEAGLLETDREPGPIVHKILVVNRDHSSEMRLDGFLESVI